MLPEVGLLPPQLLIIHMLQHLVQGHFVVAAVVGKADGHVVPILELGNEVFSPKFHGVLVQLHGQQLHQSFNQEGGFGTAGAPVKVHRRRGSENAVDIGLNIGYIVGAGIH